MDDGIKNDYKSCRERAGLTQEQAAELLDISVESLSRYENGHTPVSDKMTVKMIEVYKDPTLGFWYLHNVSDVGRMCLPKPVHSPQTNGELAFRSVIVCGGIFRKAEKVISRIMSNEQVNDDELWDFWKWIDDMENLVSQILSIVAYAKNLVRDRPRPKKATKKTKGGDIDNPKDLVRAV